MGVFTVTERSGTGVVANQTNKDFRAAINAGIRMSPYWDFLVDMEPGRSLFDLGGLLMDLETLLGCRVDIVTEKSLHWYIRDRVLEEAALL